MYKHIWVCVGTCTCVQVLPEARALDPLELDSQAIHKLPDMDARNRTQVLCEVALILNS